MYGKLYPCLKKYDNQFRVIFSTLRELMTPLEPKKKRPVGFALWKKNDIDTAPLVAQDGQSVAIPINVNILARSERHLPKTATNKQSVFEFWWAHQIWKSLGTGSFTTLKFRY